MKNRLFSLLLVACISTFALAGCGENTAEAEEVSLLKVDVASPIVTEVEVQGEYIGTLAYEDSVTVFPMLSGEVTATFFEEGDYVEEGELLFTLNDESYQLQLRNAQLTYEAAVIGTNQQLAALDLNRANAVNTLATAYEGVAQINDSYNFIAQQISDLDDTKQDLKGDKRELQEDLDEMKIDQEDADKNFDELTDAYAASTGAYSQALMTNAALGAAQSMVDQAQAAYDLAVSVDPLGTNPATVAAQAQLKQAEAQALAMAASMHQYSPAELALLSYASNGTSQAFSAAASQLSAYSQGVAGYEQGISTIDSSIDQINSSIKSLQNQQSNLNYSLAQAQRGVNLAQESLDYFDNVTAPATRASANNTLAQASLAVESANLQLGFTQVTAPVSGYISTKSVDEMTMAQAGYPAYVIVTDDGIVVSFSVPESVLQSFSVDQPVTVERNGVTYDGKITEIPLNVNQQTGLFVVKALISGDTDNLTPGTSVKVITTTRRSEDNVITIPVDCVYYEAGQSYTYTVNNGIVVKTYIETGLYDGENIEIISGVTPDMKVITTWSSDLRDGLEVQVVNDNSIQE